MTDFRPSFARSEGELDSPVSSRSSAKALPTTPGGRSGMGDSTGNPFDVEPEQLTQPSCSPSVFVTRSRRTPGSSRSFRWSIEQMAGLWPANIDEHDPSLPQHARSDALYEEQSQQAIEVFFSRHEIVPSPWEPHARLSIRPTGVSKGAQSPRESTTASVWSQTTLSIPPDADLSASLGDYYTFHVAQDKQTRPSGANTSRDSLRRKLFCNAVEARARTPERQDSEQRLSLFLDSAMGSSTPIHRALCSSPIGPTRCSQGSSPDGEGMQLSPICRQARPRAPLDTPQQRSMRLPDSPRSASDRTEEESLMTSRGSSDTSVLTAPDRSEAMLLSPGASTPSPL